MDNYIESLFDGNIKPHEKIFVNPNIIKQLNICYLKKEEFRKCLDDEQKKMFDSVIEEKNTLNSLCEKEFFKDGFKLAVRLVIGESNCLWFKSRNFA